MYTEVAKQLLTSQSTNYRPFTPFPRASERASYERLPESVKRNCVESAEKNLDFVFTGIPITSFMEFRRNGNRVNFEKLNFSKRYALNSLILGECVEYKGRFLDAILNGVYSICEESAWQLPAHNSYVRGGENYPLPDITDPVIDLFAAETGALLATVSYLFHEELDNISPFINKMILDLLRRRIFEPYMRRHFWWMGNGDEPMCNWTVWCTQNVLNAVFLTDSAFKDKPDIDGLSFDEFKKEVIRKSCYSIDCFLKDYGDDGCCDEGALYYGHSALCLFNATQIMDSVTHGAFRHLYAEEKIKNIASFIFNVHVHDNCYFNFADCSAKLDRAGAREFLFAKAIGNEEMMRFAASDFRKSSENRNEEVLNLFYRLQALFATKEILDFDISKPIIHDNIFYESVGLFIARDSRFALAVKAGDNDDSHNHNDTGSIILYKNDHPVLIDVGVETYTAKTFSSRRYEIWTMQSAFHNLPTINDVMQHDGSDFKATDVSYSFGEVSRISMDIAAAYPKEAGVASYKRSVSLHKENRVIIGDKIEFAKDSSDNSFFLSFMLCEKPEICENTVRIKTASTDQATLVFPKGTALSAETIPITDSRLKWAWEHDIYRLIARPAGTEITVEII